MPNRFLVLFGPPGAGKGTQAAKLRDHLGVPHVSTGEMFRDHLTRKTKIGLKVEQLMKSGAMVPDDVTSKMVEERLGLDDVAEGCVLDGYPRNIAQAAFLEELLRGKGEALHGVVVIRVPDEELLNRLVVRSEEQGRSDDANPEVIQRRIATYCSESQPCIEYYRDRGVPVYEIDGVGSLEQVTERITDALGVPA